MLESGSRSDRYNEVALRIEVDRAAEMPIDLRVEKLQDLAIFYRKKQKFKQYEATLLTILRLFASQQSELVLSPLHFLTRLYAKHSPQYRPQLISALEQLKHDSPRKLRRKVVEAEIQLLDYWGEHQSAEALCRNLINETKDEDLIAWNHLHCKLATVMLSQQRCLEAEELYWTAFMGLKAAGVERKVIYNTLRKFVNCYLHLHPIRPANPMRKPRLCEVSTYLQDHIPPSNQSILREYLSPSNPRIADSELYEVERFLFYSFQLLPYYEEPDYWIFQELLRLYVNRRGAHTKTHIRLRLLAMNCRGTIPSNYVSYDLLAISIAKEEMKDFQGAEESLMHFACARKRQTPGDLEQRVRRWYR